MEEKRIKLNINRFASGGEEEETIQYSIPTRIKINPDVIYPVGSIYINNNNADPSINFGGKWVLNRATAGGELIAYGMVGTNSTGGEIANGGYVGFSDSKLGSKAYDVENYIAGILAGDSGCLKVQTKGVVGFVKATMFVSGNGGSGTVGHWFNGNSNTLPTGVTLMTPGGRYPLLTSAQGGNYGGNACQYYYKVSTNDDVSFYVNPKFSAYGGTFTPSNGGVGCWLQVEVYAKPGYYIWERVE